VDEVIKCDRDYSFLKDIIKKGIVCKCVPSVQSGEGVLP